jgi:hypothetical protein
MTDIEYTLDKWLILNHKKVMKSSLQFKDLVNFGNFLLKELEGEKK